MLLESLANIKAFMEFDTQLGTTYDALLTTLIQGTSEYFQTYTGRLFESAARTVYFDGGRRIYLLNAFPISSSTVPVITVNGESQVENDDYYVDYDNGLIEFAYKIPSGQKIVKIIYTGGYTSTDSVVAVPSDLKLALTWQVVEEFNRRKSPGSSSISMPDGSRSYTGALELLPQVKDTLDRYKAVANQW